MESVRQLTDEDLAQSAQLLTEGFGDQPSDWLRRFDVWWTDHVEGEARAWVAESDGEIVGFLGNITGSVLVCAELRPSSSMTSWYVRQSHRTLALPLVASFFHQRSPAVLFNTTATQAAAAISRAFKARPVPLRSLRWTLTMPVSVRKFIRAALLKKGLNRWVADVLSVSGWLVTPAWRAYVALRYRTRSGPYQYAITEGTDDPVEFDRFLDRASTAFSLTSVRSVAQLERRLDGFNNGGLVVARDQDGKLAGYVAYEIRRSIPFNLVRMRFIDFMTVERHEECLVAIIQGCRRIARRRGVDVIEVSGGADPYHEQFRLCFPLSRRRDPDTSLLSVSGDLTDQIDWSKIHVTDYDGDASLVF